MNIQFHLTNQCNFRCKHCYQNQYNVDTISIEDYKYILDKTKEYMEKANNALFHISITGGEPFLVSNLYEYVSIASEYFKDIAILTNGSLINEDSLCKLADDNPNLNRIQISLEGPEEINDEIRGKGSFKKITAAIPIIEKANLISSVSCTISSYNYNRIQELYDSLINLPVPPTRLWFDRCIPFKSTDILTPDQFKVFLEEIRAIKTKYKETNAKTIPVSGRALQFLWDPKKMQFPYACGAGMRHFTVMPNGDLMICRRLNFPVGNLLTEDWEDIMNRISPTIKEIHSSPDDCKSCQYKIICNGGLKCLTYSKFKNFNHKDVNCPL